MDFLRRPVTLMVLGFVVLALGGFVYVTRDTTVTNAADATRCEFPPVPGVGRSLPGPGLRGGLCGRRPRRPGPRRDHRRQHAGLEVQLPHHLQQGQGLGRGRLRASDRVHRLPAQPGVRRSRAERERRHGQRRPGLQRVRIGALRRRLARERDGRRLERRWQDLRAGQGGHEASAGDRPRPAAAVGRSGALGRRRGPGLGLDLPPGRPRRHARATESCSPAPTTTARPTPTRSSSTTRPPVRTRRCRSWTKTASST